MGNIQKILTCTTLYWCNHK